MFNIYTYMYIYIYISDDLFCLVRFLRINCAQILLKAMFGK